MYKNYFKLAIRNLWRNKVFSFINITGLAMGMAGAILLLMDIAYERSVDQFHEKKDRIYKAYTENKVDGKLQSSETTSDPLAPALKQDYPEIKSVARVSETGKLLRFGDKKIIVNGSYTDPAFLDIFSFPLVKGNVVTAFSDPHSILITEQLAKKMFGEEDPMNKIIRADNADNFTVTGVLKDLPNNTEFKFEYLLPWSFYQSKGWEHGSWNDYYLSTFIELQPTANMDAVNSKISNVAIQHGSSEAGEKIFLYPLSKLHLQRHFVNGKPSGGNIILVRMLGILAIIILLIACINFMNLSTARSEKRAREVGIRKVVGAVKSALIFQFISESILLSFIAGIIALILVQSLIPVFSQLASVQLVVPWFSPFFWLAAACFVIFTGILAGSYPAFYLSSFKPVKVLKGVLKNGNALVTPRKILVVVQFVFSIFLINLTIIIKKQINHSQSREIGYEKDNLIFHSLTDDLRKNYDLVKNELINTGTATAVCKSSLPITRGYISTRDFEWAGKDVNEKTDFLVLASGADFIKTNGLKLSAGRDINTASFPTDTASCMINETAVKLIGFKIPVGQTIKEGNTNWKVVGVVKDFLIGSPDQASKPMMINGSNFANFISIKLNSNISPLQSVKNAETILKKYNPNFITDYQFASDEYATKFKGAQSAASLINSFTLVAIFISCMGLFGLASYMAENRIREIGIRKVLGASVAGITSLLAKDFIRLVLIAIVIASPLAWLFMNFFLNQFAYRTNLSGWILLIAGAATLFIALVTISSQTIKAAIANPVESLRTD